MGHQISSCFDRAKSISALHDNYSNDISLVATRVSGNSEVCQERCLRFKADKWLVSACIILASRLSSLPPSLPPSSSSSSSSMWHQAPSLPSLIPPLRSHPILARSFRLHILFLFSHSLHFAWDALLPEAPTKLGRSGCLYSATFMSYIVGLFRKSLFDWICFSPGFCSLK